MPSVYHDLRAPGPVLSPAQKYPSRTPFCLAPPAALVQNRNMKHAPRTPADFNLARWIRPLPATAAFVHPDWYIWCGSAAKGDDGLYHLFYSRWPRSRGHYAWVTHSEIAHAVSTSPTGPWEHRDVTLPRRGRAHWDGMCTHNPTILRSGGKWLLYYMGNTGDDDTTVKFNWVHRNNQRVGLATADSPFGPWKRLDAPVVAPTPGFHDAVCATNPSVAEAPDGSFLMVYKAVGDKSPLPGGGPVLHVAATAPRPEGPWKKHPDPVFLKPGVHFAAEDPFIWRGVDRWWAVVKDMEGVFTQAGKSLALFQSKDGLSWDLADHPLASGLEVIWSDKGVQKLHSLERPQVLLEEGLPTTLLCAVDFDAKREHSMNVQIPLRVP